MANKAVTLRYLLGRTSFFRISCSQLLEIALPIFWEFHADVQEVQNGVGEFKQLDCKEVLPKCVCDRCNSVFGPGLQFRLMDG